MNRSDGQGAMCVFCFSGLPPLHGGREQPGLRGGPVRLFALLQVHEVPRLRVEGDPHDVCQVHAVESGEGRLRHHHPRLCRRPHDHHSYVDLESRL